MQHDGEKKRPFLNAEQIVQQNKMAGTGDRKKFAQSLYRAKKERNKNGHSYNRLSIEWELCPYHMTVFFFLQALEKGRIQPAYKPLHAPDP